MIRRNVTRQSSCGILGLPQELACHSFVPSIVKSLIKNTLPKRIKKCSQPWLPKWSNHREIEKVKSHKKVLKYLDVTIEDGDLLIDTFVYDKASNNPEISDELCIDTADDIEVFKKNTTDRERSDELCVDDNVNIETTVNDIENNKTIHTIKKIKR